MPVEEGTTCPRCGVIADDFTPIGHKDAPSPGDLSFCAECAAPLRFTETGLELIPEEELLELRLKQEFARAEIMSRILAAGINDLPSGQPVEIKIEHPGHDGIEAHTHTVFAVPVDMEGGPPDSLDELPPEMQDQLNSAVERMRVEMMAHEVRKYVTQEIANHVLSSYGNLDASMPSVTVGALISLIRLCHESDDEMLADLNSVQEFHGYVIAICILAERGDDGGIEMLEKIAGLRPAGVDDEATAGASVR